MGAVTSAVGLGWASLSVITHAKPPGPCPLKANEVFSAVILVVLNIFHLAACMPPPGFLASHRHPSVTHPWQRHCCGQPGWPLSFVTHTTTSSVLAPEVPVHAHSGLRGISLFSRPKSEIQANYRPFKGGNNPIGPDTTFEALQKSLDSSVEAVLQDTQQQKTGRHVTGKAKAFIHPHALLSWVTLGKCINILSFYIVFYKIRITILIFSM